MELLAPEVTAWSDGGGIITAARRPIHGHPVGAPTFHLTDGRMHHLHFQVNPQKLRGLPD